MRLLALLALVAHAAARPRGYWRAVAQELRNYCECRSAEVGVAGDAARAGLGPALFAPGSCRVSRRAMVDYAKAPGRLTGWAARTPSSRSCAVAAGACRRSGLTWRPARRRRRRRASSS